MLGFNEKTSAAPDPVILTRIAEKIVKRGMTVPAVFALEMMKPLSFISSQAMVFFGPILTAFVRAETYYELSELLEDYHNVEFLVSEIERLDAAEKGSETDRMPAESEHPSSSSETHAQK
ncbi:MAG: hypothetical protein K9N11_00830 [Lentisphaeria bacterium]|nr:hypothetical protein [Candidatus Neomarinimicrobiota bacterium]MCF7841372.1 hypothetical protein [Lentisphaeria bacterium]